MVNGREAKQWNVSFVDVVQRPVSQGNVANFPAAGNHDVTSTLDVSNAARRVGLNHFLEAFGSMVPAEGSPRRLAVVGIDGGATWQPYRSSRISLEP